MVVQGSILGPIRGESRSLDYSLHVIVSSYFLVPYMVQGLGFRLHKEPKRSNQKAEMHRPFIEMNMFKA